MRILIVHNKYKLAGGEDNVVINEKQMLEENGNKVFLYEKDNNEINNYNFIQKLLLPFNYLFNIETYYDIKKLIKEKSIDIVHVHNTINIISDSAYYAAFKCNVPVVKTIHNFRLQCPNGLLYRNNAICEDCLNKGLYCAIKHNCYRNSKLETLLSVLNLKIQRRKKLYTKLNYICLTEFNKNKLLLLDHIDENKVYVKPNFILNESDDENVFKRKKQLIYAGRLDEYKGIKELFNNWINLNRNDAELIVCGTGELEKWCKSFIENNHIDNIKMLGSVDNKTVRKLMKESCGTIISSKCYEGFPMTFVESLSVGTPVIGYNIGNTGSLIKNRITGYKYNNTDDFTEAANNLLDGKNENIYKTTKNEFCSKYSKDANYKLLINIYRDIINGK